ncbi:MAG: asparagine synthetase B [Richelia sp. RM2_1_2]|nr:asparagine synthetase B [Richelia sp. SM1_7_0]NJN10513.1 asparagine synthetase B [Richelia sp. RM1_1_1]NJO59174.1 asparagine synthetase B [Richelia sp. RM2_1_2]
MSGIVSIINHNNQPINQSLLHAMTDYMAFRGPDTQETWHQDNIGLGHTLLRTTWEQEREQQPLTLDDRVWIVADVRLDGRKELVVALQARGRVITENAPDVELLLHAYHVWDNACVDHLMGDFAFIIWDSRLQRLFCVRDQYGIVPFYYAQVNNTLICSNTLNCIRLHPHISTQLNELAVADFLVWGMNMEWSTTIFDDIHRLPPAHTLTWQAGELKIQRYWQLPRTRPIIFYKHPQEYVEHFSELFEQAVSDRLRTNRIATHISGGMDSTSIAATAQKVLLERGKPFNFQALTMRDRLMMPEEDSYASMVAHYIGIPLNEMNCESYFCHVPEENLSTPLPEPIGIPARNPGNDFTKRCADHARVVLTGFGGDPALRFGEFYWLTWWKHGLRREIFQVFGHYLRTHRSPKLYLRQGRAYWRKINKEKLELPTWFNSDFVKRLDLQERYQKMNGELIDYISRYGMANSPFWSNLFEQFDPGSTGIPIKHYYPFFDLRLVNFLVSIPPVPWLVNKNILREAMKGRLPEAIRTRKKIVFEAPDGYTKVMQEMVGSWIGDLLKNTPLLEDYVDTAELSRFLQSSEIDTGKFLELEKTLAVAYWLRNSQVVSENQVKLEAVSVY